MKIKIYSIYDSKAQAFNSPFYARSKGEAIRNFQHMANEDKPDNMVWHYPEDYSLFELGDFDSEKGLLIPYKDSVALGKAIEFRRIRNEDSTKPLQ